MYGKERMAKLLRAVHPNAGVRAAYQRRLRKLVDEMQRSTVWWLRAAYRKDEARIIPDFAQDASPARMLQKVLNRLFRYWMRRWSDEAAKIAGDFIHKTQQRTTSSYEQAFRAAEAIKRVEDERLGVKVGIWVHVPGKYTSRATHRAMHGKPFLLSEGLYDSAVGRKVLPGELVACQCEYRAFVPEFGDTVTPEIQKLLERANA